MGWDARRAPPEFLCEFRRARFHGSLVWQFPTARRCCWRGVAGREEGGMRGCGVEPWRSQNLLSAIVARAGLLEVVLISDMYRADASTHCAARAAGAVVCTPTFMHACAIAPASRGTVATALDWVLATSVERLFCGAPALAYSSSAEVLRGLPGLADRSALPIPVGVSFFLAASMYSEFTLAAAA